MRCVVQCGSGCMAVRWCGVWSSAAVGVWTGRSLYVGWLCQPKREGGRAETGEREGSVFTSAKKAYYKRDERKSDLLSRERTFTSPGPWALSFSRNKVVLWIWGFQKFLQKLGSPAQRSYSAPRAGRRLRSHLRYASFARFGVGAAAGPSALSSPSFLPFFSGGAGLSGGPGGERVVG